MSEYVALSDTVRFGITVHSPSGITNQLTNTDETPRWYVYTSTSGDNPLMQGNFTARAGLIGTYTGNFVASSTNNFVTGDYVEVHASGKVQTVQGRSIIKTFVIDDLYKVNVIQMSGVPVDPITDTFFANIKFIKDSVVPADEYSVQWFKNSSPLASGATTNHAISVYKIDGTNTSLFTNKVLGYTNINHGALRYNETTNIQTSGEGYMVVTSGTIDSATRRWQNIVGLDYL
jgi:hypothetical protein